MIDILWFEGIAGVFLFSGFVTSKALSFAAAAHARELAAEEGREKRQREDDDIAYERSVWTPVAAEARYKEARAVLDRQREEWVLMLTMTDISTKERLDASDHVARIDKEVIQLIDEYRDDLVPPTKD